jgi:MtN3 and saliva related transmembrane protein
MEAVRREENSILLDGRSRQEIKRKTRFSRAWENHEMKEIVAVVFGLGLLCNALLFVPQAVAVWRKKTDEGVSLITFGGFSVLQIIGIVHGVYQHDWSLILGMSASLLSCGTVTLLTAFYRMQRLGKAAPGN